MRGILFWPAFWKPRGGENIKPSGWGQIQSLVRAGLAGKVFSIGDRLSCSKDDTTLAWDVIGFDIDEPADSQFEHSMTLQLHDCLSSAMQFDEREAFYYAEEGLEAGTYYFTLAEDLNKWTAGDYQFTLTADVPSGGQLCFSGYGSTALTALNVQVYESNAAVSASESAEITSGSEGTFLGTIKLSEVQDYINSAQRSASGSGNWSESAIRQFLNSGAETGAVWEPKTKFDRSPSWVSSTAGFMNGMDEDFLAAVGNAKKVTAMNKVCDGGGSGTTDDNFWLLSKREVYAGDEVYTVNEGGPYPYYSDYSDLAAAGASADANRIKYLNGTAYIWWLRTPYSGNGNGARVITRTGVFSSYGASEKQGICPGCCII